MKNSLSKTEITTLVIAADSITYTSDMGDERTYPIGGGCWENGTQISGTCDTPFRKILLWAIEQMLKYAKTLTPSNS